VRRVLPSAEDTSAPVDPAELAKTLLPAAGGPSAPSNRAAMPMAHDLFRGHPVMVNGQVVGGHRPDLGDRASIDRWCATNANRCCRCSSPR
jgi:hypothetical protein